MAFTKFLSIQGMFEKQTGSSYSILNGANTNSNTWKKYPAKYNANIYGLTEIAFDLSDATISGTNDYFS